MALPELDLRAWADAEFVVGHILSLSITEYAHLEECLAIGSFAQDELAHARLFYELCGIRGRALDEAVFLRPAEGFSVPPLVAYQPGDFAELVVKQYLYELLDQLRLEAASAMGELRGVLPAMAREEQMHRDHSERWLRVLAGSSGRPRLEAACERVGRLCGQASVGDDQGLRLASAWRKRAEEGLQKLGLSLGAPAEASDWRAALDSLVARMQSVFRERPEVVQG